MITLQTKKQKKKMNSSHVFYFTLRGYIDISLCTHCFFVIFMIIYVVIIGCNVVLIVVICVNRSLHEPMYMFLCSLFVNELYGSSGLFPFLLVQVLSDVHTVSAPFCFLQVFCLYTYGSVEFTNLAVMSYDRYVAICQPLQYKTIMSQRRVVFLIYVIWLPPFLAVSVTTCLSLSLQLCGNAINRIFCDNHSIIKLACSEPRVNNVYELIMTFLTVCVPVCVILYTYMRILKVCFSGSKQTRQKAVSTCTPHLISVVSFCFCVLYKILESRFNDNNVPRLVKICLVLYFLTCQTVFNPVLYGLSLSKIRTVCQRLILQSLGKNEQFCLSFRERRHF
ncbi:olfactory receptor 10A6-like [Nematolebias whitei]|uniref:olfactory receptor 10A6-like n=1 Tax=Nematolebias whitei TaxID=451745 RepID=UPI0018985558|nr:olfactory receptor 10A6-like [Nematolebias whitei]